jgi:hypothetical protein
MKCLKAAQVGARAEQGKLRKPSQLFVILSTFDSLYVLSYCLCSSAQKSDRLSAAELPTVCRLAHTLSRFSVELQTVDRGMYGSFSHLTPYYHGEWLALLFSKSN